jgi:predicted HicB family RNase H-like nuclease
MCHYRAVASGKLTLRVPPALHDQLIEQAAQQGVSLNALIVALLAGGVGFKLAD